MNELGPIIFPNLWGLKLNPPRSFSIGGFEIYFYGVIIALGLMLSVIYGLKRSKQFGLKQDDILDGVLWIVPLAIVCTRLYYVFSSWSSFAVYEANKFVLGKTLLNIIDLRDGGLAIYGGVIGAAIGVLIFAKVKKVSLLAVLDLVAISFLIGQSIGRWGNFMNREAFGEYSNGLFAMQIWESNLGSGDSAAFQQLRQNAVMIDGHSFISVHPTFLYESVWNICGFVLLHFLSKKRQYDGQMALGYVAWYGLGRTIIEGLRMDSLYWGPFRASQLLAAVTCVAAGIALILMCLKTHDRANLFVNRVAAMQQTEDALEETEQTEDVLEEAVMEEPAEASAEEATDEPAEESSEETAEESEEETEA